MVDLNTDLVFQYIKSLLFYDAKNPDQSSFIAQEHVVGWRLSLAFFSFVAFLTGMTMLLMLYIWIINRQTHVKKTKGSHVGFKLQEDGADDDESVSDDDDDDDSTGGGGHIEALDELGEKSTEGIRQSQKWRRLMSDVKRSKAWESIMKFEVDEDEDVEEEALREARAKPVKGRRKDIGPARADPSADRPTYGNLAEIASKIKVFSYLGQDALKLCLSEADYVDLEPGQELFERGSFDGSLFVVLTGGVRCLFHDYPLAEEDIEADTPDNEKLLSFDSGPGSVVTPLLAMLEALVQHQIIQANADDLDEAVLPRPLSMADGVSAVATKNSRLIKVPARCYSMVMDSFPADVHRVATTIIQRVQRVTLQTLVKTLGLQTELLKRGVAFETSSAWESRMLSQEWYRLSSSLTGSTTGTNALAISAIIRDATLVAAEELELPMASAATLQQHSTIVSLKKGETLIKTGEPHHALYFILFGEMDVGSEIPKDALSSSFQRFTKVGPGAIVGRLACFSGDVSIFSAKAFNDGVKLLRIGKVAFDKLLIANPRAMVSCFEHILRLMSPSVHLLNWASQWQFVQASEIVAKKGDACESMIMILNGRLRASYHSHGHSIEEFGRGKCVGDIPGITKTSWPCKLYAIRNSEIATVPIKVLEALIRTHPSAGLHFSRVIASQVARSDTQAGQEPVLGGRGSGRRNVILRRITSGGSRPAFPSIMPTYGLSLATIAVVPMVSGIDASAFCEAMTSSLGRIAPTKLLTKGMARNHLGEKVYNHQNAVHELKMTRFLAEVEERNRLVVFQSDASYTWWTRTCIGQADAILLLVSANEAPAPGKIEQCLEWAYESMQVRIEVVVIDDSDASTSEEDTEGLTNPEIVVSDALDNWSEERTWISGHHLARSPFSKYKRDIFRLCRRMTGLSVGLVLGGGGARGLAHLGVIKALLEAGITVDLVGGTSQGAFIGAIFARSPDDFKLLMERSREMAVQMTSPINKILDLTLPLTSMFSGYRFNRQIMESLGRTTRIQDLVLKFFCVSTDIQRCELKVHTKGILWKYVRASMSLTGYLPPISENGSLLVDGGYMSVIPTDIMKEQAGARTIISVDVSAELQKNYYEYGTHLSGWWLLANSWNPFTKTVNVPSMADLQDALRWVSSDQHRRRMESVADLHLRPPIQDFGTLEFDKFDEIVERGYAYAKPLVEELVRKNPSLVTNKVSPGKMKDD